MNSVLANTADLMVSEDYKDRFKAEYIQLKNRYEGLLNMLKKWDEGTLNFTPTCPRELYEIQIQGMQTYLKALTERAQLEQVNISDLAC